MDILSSTYLDTCQLISLNNIDERLCSSGTLTDSLAYLLQKLDKHYLSNTWTAWTRTPVVSASRPGRYTIVLYINMLLVLVAPKRIWKRGHCATEMQN